MDGKKKLTPAAAGDGLSAAPPSTSTDRSSTGVCCSEYKRVPKAAVVATVPAPPRASWLEVASDFRDNPKKIADVVYSFYTSKGYTMPRDVFMKAMATVEVNPGFPSDLGPYMQKHAEVLLAEKKIPKIPDWKTAMRPDFMEKARATG